MSIGQYIKLKGAVGKNAPNHSEDVMTVQARLNVWIYKGHLPKVDFLAVDGDCGDKTKLAIGAFQMMILGHKNPDCRVDPGGKTLMAMYESLLTPQKTLQEAWEEWKKDWNKPQPKASNWVVSADEADKIQRAWGTEILDYIKVPPVEGAAESKEFSPPGFLRDRYETVFVWKSGNSKTKCITKPNDRVQVLAMLRSDHAYWAARMKDNRIGIEMLKTSSASAIRDYRLYIIERKYCPPAAKLTLEQISKDTIYQMFIGMFQLMSPVGVPTAHANQSGAAANFTKAIVSWYNDPKGKPIWRHF